jgi:hypothetical protein
MIRFIIIVIILVLALSYFGISIRHIAESPTGTDNFEYLTNTLSMGWDILVAWVAGFAEGIKGAVS